MCNDEATTNELKTESDSLSEEDLPSQSDEVVNQPPSTIPINPKIVLVWTIENAIALGILLIAVSAGGIALGAYTNAPKPVLLLVWLTVLSVFLSRVFWLPKRAYEHWSYKINDQTLELRYGVVWQKSVAIPLSRLQHVDLHRGPLERHYVLSTLEVHTAGTRNASHRIPGLDSDRAIELRDELVIAAKIEQA